MARRTTCAFVDTHTVANLANSHRDRCRAAHARDLRPGRESPAHQCPIVARPHRMAVRSKMVRHLCMHREEAPGLPHRFESSHGAFSQARGLVRVLGPVVQQRLRMMRNTEHQILLGRHHNRIASYETPTLRSSIISWKSRKLRLKRKYSHTQWAIISRGKR